MPDFATHQLFGEALELPEAARLHPALFCWGLQGPDPLFYRKVLTGGAPHHKLGNRMHEEKTQRLFASLVAYCRQSEGRVKEQAEAYLYGFAGHYAVDCTLHPYVFSQQRRLGAEQPHRQEGGLHCGIESDMDNDLYAYLRGCPVTDFHPGEGCRLSASEEQTVGALYTYLLYDTYQVLLAPKEIIAALRDTLAVQKLLFSGSKAVMGIAAALDRVEGQHGVFACHVKGRQPQWDSLNLNGGCWTNPWTGQESSATVLGLLDRAAERFYELTRILERNVAGALLPLPLSLDFSGRPLE